MQPKACSENKYLTMVTFKEQESCCDNAFRENAPYWHLYTSGKDMPLLFRNDDEFKFVMNVMARSSFDFPDVWIVSFVLMGNHVHILASGERTRVSLMFKTLRQRIARGIGGLPMSFTPNLKHIADLRTLRNTVVYIHRNGYVVDKAHTPFSYPWGTGPFYFNRSFHSSCLSDLKDAELRLMFRARNPRLPAGLLVADGYVAPPSYCRIEKGMAMFHDAHQYFSMVSKGVESYLELAVDLDDVEFLTDNELFLQAWRIVRERYGAGSLKEISKNQRMELAKMMKHEYRSSNSQICRVLNLTQFEVDSMFPLSATHGR